MRGSAVKSMVIGVAVALAAVGIVVQDLSPSAMGQQAQGQQGTLASQQIPPGL